MTQVYDGSYSHLISEAMENFRGVIAPMVERAGKLVNAKPITPGVYDVITDPGQYYEAYYTAVRNYYEYPDAKVDPSGNVLYNPGLSPSEAHIKANQIILGDTSAGGLGYLVYTIPAGQSLISGQLDR